jgi:hypothetical protein
MNYGPGNIDCEPGFVNPGYWDPNGTATDANDDFFVMGDYHLKSAGWRFDTDANDWAWDEETSRCIDAGNPADGLGDEPVTLWCDPKHRFGENKRIDMGAYGGTSEASMGPVGWQVSSDIDNDGRAELKDFAWLVGNWEGSGEGTVGDLSRDGQVGMEDLLIFTGEWKNPGGRDSGIGSSEDGVRR